ncbi:MAG: amidase family protein [Pseudomonadota bacterium]
MIQHATETETRRRLERIAIEDGALRSFIRIDESEALAAATASDARHRAGNALGPLDGVPVAVKDNLACSGKPWTAGIDGRRDVIAETDATAVARLRAAGAVVLGSANMEEAALGAITDNPTFGRCMNPLGEGLTPGGSSGGSAAALAGGFADLALGTDTMGSVRVPAAYCGIAGIKPTFGAVDREGLALLSPSLDTIGPMARDVRLLWPALKVLGTQEALAMWTEPSTKVDLSGVRFGIPKQLQSVDCEPANKAALDLAHRAINTLGGTVREVDLARWDPHEARRAGLLMIEAEGATELADLMDRPGVISDHLRSLLVYGRDASKAKLNAARIEIERAADAAHRALEIVDALLLPTTPQRAFAHGVPAPSNQADLTALANFAGCPAVALPVVLPGEALPASIQLVGPKWSDPTLLAWAELLAPRLT